MTTQESPRPARATNGPTLCTIKVAVIGAGGHVGLPFSLALTRANFHVIGVDTDAERCREVMNGRVGFVEEGAETALSSARRKGLLMMTTVLDDARAASVLVVIVGTPVDEHLNPVQRPLLSLVERIGAQLRHGQLIVLRSTVAPGTTERVREVLQAESGLVEGQDFHLVMAPDRSQQGRTLKEIVSLPQIIGAFSDDGFEVARSFFRRLVRAPCLQLTPIEAEIGKLITNMTRYTMFALANEYYLLADELGGNIHRIFDACNRDYPRLDLPDPGPNVGGPCLYKDGFFLVNHVPYAELISTSFKINEFMPQHIIRKISAIEGARKIAILGMTFKADSDDIRNSLSFRLRKGLEASGYEVACYDPYVPRWADPANIRASHVAVLMTPHTEFASLERVASLIDNPNCVMVDIWGSWEQARGRGDNGYFRCGDFR